MPSSIELLESPFPIPSTHKNNTVIKTVEKCFRLNSQAWLEGQRLGNAPIPDASLDHFMQLSQLLNSSNMDTILDQTLCYKTGRFRDYTFHQRYRSIWNASDPLQIRDWQIRLLYLAIHRLHHLPALPEYQLRKECEATFSSSTSAGLPYGRISNFDYECPQAQFLVTVLKSVGMGAVFRGSAMPSIIMALSTNRIPLFISHLDPNDFAEASPLSTPFLLASCPRHDLQCVFLPLSPCVLTRDDLRNATVLTKQEARTLKGSGKYQTAQHKHVRVLIHNARVVEQSMHFVFRKKAHQAIWDLLHDWKNDVTNRTSHQRTNRKSDYFVEQWKVMTAVADSFKPTPTKYNPRFIHDEMALILLRAVQLYLMRPNDMARHEIERQVAETMLPHGNANKRLYFGLPIRGECFETELRSSSILHVDGTAYDFCSRCVKVPTNAGSKAHASHLNDTWNEFSASGRSITIRANKEPSS